MNPATCEPPAPAGGSRRRTREVAFLKGASGSCRRVLHSKEINGSQIMGHDFAPVNLVVRFIHQARIVVAGQILSSLLKRQNSNAPRIRT
jgi:hypothetical protein